MIPEDPARVRVPLRPAAPEGHSGAPSVPFSETTAWSPGDADARAELDDVAEEIDPRLGEIEEDVDTLGGLAFVLAGRVPEPGEIIPHEQSGWKLEVLASDGRRVTRLRLHPPVEQELEAEEA